MHNGIQLKLEPAGIFLPRIVFLRLVAFRTQDIVLSYKGGIREDTLMLMINIFSSRKTIR